MAKRKFSRAQNDYMQAKALYDVTMRETEADIRANVGQIADDASDADVDAYCDREVAYMKSKGYDVRQREATSRLREAEMAVIDWAFSACRNQLPAEWRKIEGDLANLRETCRKNPNWRWKLVKVSMLLDAKEVR